MKREIVVAGILVFSFLNCAKHTTALDPLVVGDLNIPQDSVILNPYGAAPLCALVKYSWDVSGKTRILVHGKNGANSDIVQMFNDTGLHHVVPIMGLYANFNNTVDMTLVDCNGNDRAKTTLSIQTGVLPATLPTSIAATTQQLDKMENGLNLVSSLCRFNPNIPFFLDSYGDIRWLVDFSADSALRTLSYDCGIARLANGNYYFGNMNRATIYEIDLFGRVVKRWPLPGYRFHHNVQEKPDGNFLATVTKIGSTHTTGDSTIEDYVIEIDRTTGAIKNEWDLKESLNEYRNALGSDTNQADWFHGNAVIYDPSDNTIIVSGRMQGVVKLTYDNQVKWILAPHRGWQVNKKGVDLNQLLLTPLDANGNVISDTSVAEGSTNHTDFEWNWYQHSPLIMPNNDLLLFDNGSSRNFNFADTLNCYSRAVVYRINATAKTVQQIWAYGKDRGTATFSKVISSVQYLSEIKHVLFCPGFMVANNGGFGGKIVEIDYDTKEVVFEMSVTTQNGIGFHRAKRMSLYATDSLPVSE